MHNVEGLAQICYERHIAGKHKHPEVVERVIAVKRKWIESNPVYGFEISDAGGTEVPRSRWLNREELAALAQAMRETPNFGRLNELAVWLLQWMRNIVSMGNAGLPPSA